MGLSVGVTAGVVVGGIKAVVRRKPAAAKQVEVVQKWMCVIAGVLKYVTFMLLVLGLIWCGYFLVMGIRFPEQSDYANNMAELIVAVLTVISILFAFVEFLRRKDGQK